MEVEVEVWTRNWRCCATAVCATPWQSTHQPQATSRSAKGPSVYSIFQMSATLPACRKRPIETIVHPLAAASPVSSTPVLSRVELCAAGAFLAAAVVVTASGSSLDLIPLTLTALVAHQSQPDTNAPRGAQMSSGLYGEATFIIRLRLRTW